MDLIDSLVKEGWLKTPGIIKAFKEIKRADFFPEDTKDFAEINSAFPIGFGQTISQPLVVAFMIEELQPHSGEKILDIGSGSGWTTALLGEIVGSEGKVIGIEIIKELKEFGEKNVSKYNFVKKRIVEFICADGSKGYPNISSRPELAGGFDKILASASAREIPQAWKDQLKIGGRIVTPVGTSIWLFIKKSDKAFDKFEYPGFVFVPLITKGK